MTSEHIASPPYRIEKMQVANMAELPWRGHKKGTLQEQRDFLSNVINNIEALVVVLDKDGRIIHFNKACERLFYFTDAEIKVKLSARQLPLPKEISEIKTLLRNLWSAKDAGYHENQWMTSSGEERTIIWSITVLPDRTDGVEYILATGTDITERKRAEDAILRRNRELSVLYTISRATAQSLNLEETLNNAMEATLEALDVEVGGIYLLEPEGETLTLRVVRGVSDEVARNLQHVKLGEGISGRATAEKKPIVLDVQDYLSQRLAPYIVQQKFQSLASTPLLSAGQAVGAMNLSTRRVRVFPPEELELLTAIGQQLGSVVQNAQLYEAVQRELAERKLAEEALVKEQYLLSALMDNLPDHIYFKDTESHFTRINKAQAEWLGLADLAQALGKTDFDFFSEDHARPAYEDELRIIRTDQPLVNIEERETWSDRPDTWVSTTKLPLRDKEGRIIGTFGVSRDITERKQAETRLLEERNLLRTLIDNLPDSIFVKDTESRILVNNPAHRALLGASSLDEVVGKIDFDFFCVHQI
jgi:PAS domain S-box-containing protein